MSLWPEQFIHLSYGSAAFESRKMRKNTPANSVDFSPAHRIFHPAVGTFSFPLVPFGD